MVTLVMAHKLDFVADGWRLKVSENTHWKIKKMKMQSQHVALTECYELPFRHSTWKFPMERLL